MRSRGEGRPLLRGGSITGPSQGTVMSAPLSSVKEKSGCKIKCWRLSCILSWVISATLQSKAIEIQPGYRGGVILSPLPSPPPGTPGSAHGHGQGSERQALGPRAAARWLVIRAQWSDEKMTDDGAGETTLGDTQQWTRVAVHLPDHGAHTSKTTEAPGELQARVKNNSGTSAHHS